MALYDILLAQKLGGSNASKSMISDAYDSTKTYAVGDYCIYNNTLYICKTAITTAEEWTPAHWDATNCTTELSELKGTLDDKGNMFSEKFTNGVSQTITYLSNKTVLLFGARQRNGFLYIIPPDMKETPIKVFDDNNVITSISHGDGTLTITATSDYGSNIVINGIYIS